MAACFTVKNPQDAAIYITGLSASHSWPCRRPQTRGSPGTLPPSSLNSRRHSDKSLQPNSTGYRPVLAVTRRSLPAAETMHSTPAASLESLDRPTFTEVPRLQEERFRRNAALTLGRPIPPVEALKSKSAFVSRNASTKAKPSLSFFSKSKVDLRTGFMRSLSRPTPGELDLKYHRDSHENRRREKDCQPDLDKLNMSEIMSMLKSKLPVEKRVGFQDTTPCSQQCQEKGDAQNAVNDNDLGIKQLPKVNLKDSLNSRDIICCEPPLVSSKNKNKDHKLRLQALYSQFRKYREDAKSREIAMQYHNSKDNDSFFAERVLKRQSRPSDDEKRARINILNLESFGYDGDLAATDCQTTSSESCSEHSSWSGSSDTHTPRSAAALLLHPDLQGELCRQGPACSGTKSGKQTRSTRRVRYAGPALAPSWEANRSGTQDRTKRTWKNYPNDKGVCFDLEPHHYKVPFAEYINITHPMRPPANTPVSILSEDEDELLNTAEWESDGWSLTYHAKRAPTPSSTVSGLVKGQVRVESHGSSKATINVFLPQMT